jgi:carboxypeptidase Taq
MAEIRDLGSVVALLSWDQETYMPPKGLAARAEQLATLQGLQHDRLSAPELGDIIATLESTGPDEPVKKAQLREVKFERERATRIPTDLVKEIARAQARALGTWAQARSAQDFSIFAPDLTRLVQLRRAMADAYGPPAGGERYDALLEGYEKGMRVARLQPLLESLGDWLAPTIQVLAANAPARTEFLDGSFAAESQWAFAEHLLGAMGFDKDAGRMDKSAHPFTTSFDPDDVRITIRIYEDLPLSSVFSTIHEAGHALYEQGLPTSQRRTFVCSAASMGLHESQSRLWENIVGRSLPFWQAYLPEYQRLFPQLSRVSLDPFHAAVNQVRPSLIRVEADEVTYNMHIILRFQLELGLMRDDLRVDDLPGAWNQASKALLGISPSNDSEGVLQDIHWAWGEFGYFPTYAIGNLYSASLMRAAERDMPDIWTAVSEGRLLPLREWLNRNVHSAGRLREAEAIVHDCTGNGLNAGDFIRYLKNKYEALFNVSLGNG